MGDTVLLKKKDEMGLVLRHQALDILSLLDTPGVEVLFWDQRNMATWLDTCRNSAPDCKNTPIHCGSLRSDGNATGSGASRWAWISHGLGLALVTIHRA